jgi:hypothetical protein
MVRSELRFARQKYTEENLNLFALKYTSFFPDLLKFFFLDGDKFQIYVKLTAPRHSRFTLARVSGGVGGGKLPLSLFLFHLSLVLLLAKMKSEEN